MHRMRRLFLTTDTGEGRKELEDAKASILVQLGWLARVGAFAMGVGLIELFFPNFFNFPYWKWTLDWRDVGKFYPIFLLALGWNVIFFKQNQKASSKYDGAILATESFGFVLIGLWEELLYRWALIPFAMIGLGCTNWLFGFGISYGIGVAGLVGAYFCFRSVIKDKGGIADGLLGSACLAAASFFFWLGITIDPIYWLFGKILIPIADWTSFRMMGPAFTHPSDTLFLFGIFAANIAFRNGHKYQGLIGVVNSWYLGMVFIYATFNYGILTAIVIHTLYDLIFPLMKYISRKLPRNT